jgi:hypothetical protein
MAILPSLQQLRFLCALAEQCHFGRAAESCAVTQSTLSGGIKELEARLGITLFERSHRHVMLTPLGKHIATRAQRLLVDAEELVGLARNAQEPLSGPLPAIPSAWLRRDVFHPCDGGPLLRTIYLATLVWPTRDVREGSKNRPWGASEQGPFIPQQRTCGDYCGMSVWCHGQKSPKLNSITR